MRGHPSHFFIPNEVEFSAAALNETSKGACRAQCADGCDEQAASTETLDDRRCDRNEIKGTKQSLIAQAVKTNEVEFSAAALNETKQGLVCAKQYYVIARSNLLRRGNLCFFALSLGLLRFARNDRVLYVVIPNLFRNLLKQKDPEKAPEEIKDSRVAYRQLRAKLNACRSLRLTHLSSG